MKYVVFPQKLLLTRRACLIGLIVQVMKRLPGLKKLDGVPVSLEEREAAEAFRG